MSKSETPVKTRKVRPKPELSVFEEELNVPFNKQEFLPDLPPHARGQTPDYFPTEVKAKIEEPKLEPKVAKSVPASDSKRVTNGVQTDNKQITEWVTNGVQTDNKQITTVEVVQTNSTRADEKRVTQRITSNRVNGVQTDNKRVTKQCWETLRGHESKLLQLIFNECRLSGNLLSPPLTLERMSIHLESRKGTVKTIIYRLVQKGFVKRESSATGRGGFTRFRLEKEIYQALLIQETDNKWVTNGVQTDNKEVTQRVTQRVTSAPSSSSVLDLENFKTTTTGEGEVAGSLVSQLTAEWEQIDFSPLSDIGFTRSHLIQIFKQAKLPAGEVQDSIHFFAFDLKKNNKGAALNGPPLNFFMGILRKGMPYTPPENYEAPEEEARRKYLEGKRRIEEKRIAQAQELWDLHFREWEAKLSSEESNKILPDYGKRLGPVRDNCLKKHFAESVWPELRERIPGYEALFAGLLTFALKKDEESSDPTSHIGQA